MHKFQRDYEIVFWSLFGFLSVIFSILSIWFKGSFFGFAIGALSSYLLFMITRIFGMIPLKKRKSLIFLNILKMFVFFIYLTAVILSIYHINLKIYALKKYTWLSEFTLPINMFVFFGSVGFNFFVIIATFIYSKYKGGKIGRN
ncbi:hypothetical protein ACR82Z_04430 [Mycoplasma sp. 6243]|uniref:hypothetical protein n=1 Tax=Mycoplasma sp. 6243 TaxID=3440865 RepID=UPI003EBF432A